MNRIILIGNGFDLAHGLPTRYEDFINWYWEKWLYNLRTCHYKTLADGLCKFSIKTGQDTWQSLLWQQGYTLNSPKGVDFVNSILDDKQNFEVIQSHLLYRICKSIQDKKWVDFENEYYCLLKEAIESPENLGCTPQEINRQLHCILDLLTQYLISLQVKPLTCTDLIRNIILEPIKVEDVAIGSIQHIYEHCNYWANQGRHTLYKQLGEDEVPYEQALAIRANVDEFLQKNIAKYPDGKLGVIDINKTPDELLRPFNTMLLSFNYTWITDIYAQQCSCLVNHIHGDLKDPPKMIFGYGDELDDDYKGLLKQEDNECLKNIKSIKYLESTNYRSMLQFIESDPFQVCIMGHSCGNSDRTLLNTLFEHKNCVSIKPYYYRKSDGTDNYMELVQNICRNFTDMELMRDRVVNKTFCEPLPQIKLNDRI